MISSYIRICGTIRVSGGHLLTPAEVTYSDLWMSWCRVECATS